MKIELLLVVSVLIAIAIISLFISILNVFITKKQTNFSSSDFFYSLSIGILAGTSANIHIMMLTIVVIAIWSVILGMKTEKNRKEKEKITNNEFA